jgi:hypothetical protein
MDREEEGLRHDDPGGTLEPVSHLGAGRRQMVMHTDSEVGWS